jgi:hypothetical protein
MAWGESFIKIHHCCKVSNKKISTFAYLNLKIDFRLGCRFFSSQTIGSWRHKQYFLDCNANRRRCYIMRPCFGDVIASSHMVIYCNRNTVTPKYIIMRTNATEMLVGKVVKWIENLKTIKSMQDIFWKGNVVLWFILRYLNFVGFGD